MTEAGQIIDNLINTEGIHAFVFICEAVDKYRPMFDSVQVILSNGKKIPLTAIDKKVVQKVDETRKILKREDRITWALRHFKKALVEQLLWMVRNDPDYFKRKFRATPVPAEQQYSLMRHLRNTQDIDITPFQEFDPEDMDNTESPYSGFSTIDAINERIGHYLEVAATKGKGSPDQPIEKFRFDSGKDHILTYGEIVSFLRRQEIDLRHAGFPGAIEIKRNPRGGKFDLEDKEGPIETIVKFPDGWRWLNLHRVCSPMRDDRQVASDIAITGHCANTASQLGVTALELVQPLGGDLYKHQAFFILHQNGRLGEMKGRKNQKPSPRLEKYIFELLRQYKLIKGVGEATSYDASADFSVSDLTPAHRKILAAERPELNINKKWVQGEEE